MTDMTDLTRDGGTVARVVPPRGIDTALFGRLEVAARRAAGGREPAHDFFHVLRVVANVRELVRLEGGDEAVAVSAAMLHELFALPKGHPDSARAGDICAEHARALMAREGADPSFTERVVSAIGDHAFSKGASPDALEAKLLQDADRLDALGAIGLARMWATCADMKRPFYAEDDPFCVTRLPDDKSFGLDHVFKKLLLLEARFHTRSARELAAPRVAFVRAFLAQLAAEVSAGQPGSA